MIKIILLKDAVADKSFVFCKAVVLSEQGFELPIATGMLRKPKALVAKAETVAMELPKEFLGRLTAVTKDFQVDDEVKQYTTLEVL